MGDPWRVVRYGWCAPGPLALGRAISRYGLDCSVVVFSRTGRNVDGPFTASEYRSLNGSRRPKLKLTHYPTPMSLDALGGCGVAWLGDKQHAVRALVIARACSGSPTQSLIARGIAAQRPFVGNRLWVTSVSDPDGYRLGFDVPPTCRRTRYIPTRSSDESVRYLRHRTAQPDVALKAVEFCPFAMAMRDEHD